jgi:hypothetical protein
MEDTLRERRLSEIGKGVNEDGAVDVNGKRERATVEFPSTI